MKEITGHMECLAEGNSLIWRAILWVLGQPVEFTVEEEFAVNNMLFIALLFTVLCLGVLPNEVLNIYNLTESAGGRLI